MATSLGYFVGNNPLAAIAHAKCVVKLALVDTIPTQKI